MEGYFREELAASAQNAWINDRSQEAARGQAAAP
jgi:hypothetical protein